MSGTRLMKPFFDRPAADVARALLGQVLVHNGIRAIITETEAYLMTADDASHYVQGKRRALEAFAKGPGTIYIHPMRGWQGIDLVAAGGSVLLRAVDLPGAGGPGKLTHVLGITDNKLHGQNVADPACPLWLMGAEVAGEVVVGPRIGISKSAGLPLRFVLKKP